MKVKLLFVIFLLIPIILPAQVKVEKVLETTSVAEYNRWVKENKEKYSGLKAVYINIENVENMRKYKVQYWDKDGNLIKEETIEGWCLVRPENIYTKDKVIIDRFDKPMYPSKVETEVRDRYGNQLFTLKDVWGLYNVGMDLYIGRPGEDPRYSPYSQIFNGKGKFINTLWGMGNIDARTTRVPADSSYVAFIFIESDKFINIALINRNGKELWRKNISKSYGVELFISKDGSRIGVSAMEKIYMYNRYGILLHIYEFPNCYPYPSALSFDGHYLIALEKSNLYLWDNDKYKLIWEKELPSEPINIKFVNRNKYILVIFPSHDIQIYKIEGNLLNSFNIPLGNREFFKRTSSGEVIKITKPEWEWGLEVIKNLIIIKSRTKVLIYKIKEEE